MRSNLESSIIPAFEMSCKAMFEQIDSTFQKGLLKHTTAIQQHFETAHSPLASALRVCEYHMIHMLGSGSHAIYVLICCYSPVFLFLVDRIFTSAHINSCDFELFDEFILLMELFG